MAVLGCLLLLAQHHHFYLHPSTSPPVLRNATSFELGDEGGLKLDKGEEFEMTWGSLKAKTTTVFGIPAP